MAMQGDELLETQPEHYLSRKNLFPPCHLPLVHWSFVCHFLPAHFLSKYLLCFMIPPIIQVSSFCPQSKQAPNIT
jgi:hypothetical protein